MHTTENINEKTEQTRVDPKTHSQSVSSTLMCAKHIYDQSGGLATHRGEDK